MGNTTEMKYSLKWKNFEGVFMSQFETLKDDEDFVDVTLSCCGQSIKAHKVVLSACSPYLKRLFKEHPCKHPIIILEYLNFTNLAGLIQFIYTGQVNVEQHELPAFLKAAEILQIRGLTESPEINCLWQTNPPIPPQAPGSSPPRKRSKECDSRSKKFSDKKKQRNESFDKDIKVIEYSETEDKDEESEGNNDDEQNTEDKGDSKNTKDNDDENQLTNCENNKEENSETPNDYEGMEESIQFECRPFTNFDECFPEDVRQSHWPNTRTCPLCHRTYSNTSNLRQHMKLIHNPTLVTCSICLKTFKTALYLRRHLIGFHEMEPSTNVVSVECSAVLNQSPNTSLNAVGYREIITESESCEIVE